MPICLNGHVRFRTGCGACEAGNYRSEGPSTGGAIGPRPSGRTPSRPDWPSCPQCDHEADSWHAVYDHMIESHPGTVVSARIQQHFEYLLGESAVPELDEDELSALFFPPGQVNENVSLFSRHAFVPQQQNTHLCSHCSNLHSARIHSIADEPQQPQAETPEMAGQKPNREWSGRRHFQGMSPRELEAERQRALRLTKRKGPSKWILAAFAMIGVLAVVIAAGYFLVERGTDKMLAEEAPIQPAVPPSQNPEDPIPESAPGLAPVATPTSVPTPTVAPIPTVTPTPCTPTPTLTLNEIFEKNTSGELSDQDTVKELEVRSSRIPEGCQSNVPSIAPSLVPTLRPTSTPKPTLRPTATPPIIVGSLRGSPEWITELEFEIHQLVNVERQKNALSVLSRDSTLAKVARGHSEDMALNNYFEHENLVGQDATDRGNAIGYTCRKDYVGYYTIGIAENIFQGWLYSTFTSRSRNYMSLEEIASRTVDGWMDSPGHRENILTGTYDQEGIGVSIGAEESVWVTQNFR